MITDCFRYFSTLFATGKNAMSQETKKRILNSVIRLAVILVIAFLIGHFLRQNNTQESVSDSQPAQSQENTSDSDITTADGTSLEEADDNTKEAIYTFRNRYLRDEHFQKHGDEFDYASVQCVRALKKLGYKVAIVIDRFENKKLTKKEDFRNL